MKVSGIPAMIALMAAPPTAPPRGVDIVCDYADFVEQDVAFRADYSASPTGTAFTANYVTDAYFMASLPEDRGRFWMETALGEYGSFAYGTEAKMLYGGFECDYALAVTPSGPVGWDGVAFMFDYAAPRFVAQTYPPPIVFTLDYSQPGRSFYADYAVGTYQGETGTAGFGRFRLNDETAILSGTPLRTPSGFTRDQMVVDFYTDDRLGYFVLGSAILGGDAV